MEASFLEKGPKDREVACCYEFSDHGVKSTLPFLKTLYLTNFTITTYIYRMTILTPLSEIFVFKEHSLTDALCAPTNTT